MITTAASSAVVAVEKRNLVMYVGNRVKVTLDDASVLTGRLVSLSSCGNLILTDVERQRILKRRRNRDGYMKQPVSATLPSVVSVGYDSGITTDKSVIDHVGGREANSSRMVQLANAAPTSSLTGATTSSRVPVSHYNPCLPPLHDYASACADLDDWIQEIDRTAHGISAGAAADSLTEALFYRGVCRARLSQVKDAVADFTEVLQRKPGHRRAHYERAACHAQLDDFFNAIADYEAALQLDEVGREKENLRRYRELSPLRQHVPTPASEKAQLTDGPLAPEQSAPCSPVSTRGAMASSSRCMPMNEASDSAVATVSLSEYTMPAAGAGATTLPAILGRRISQGFSDHSQDNLTSVSSSTESLLDGSVMEVDETNGHGMLAAMDPTCILSSSNSEGEEWLPDDVLEAETWQQSKGSCAAARLATAGQLLLNAHYFYQPFADALQALFNRAFCEDKLKNYTRAIEDYTAALDLDPRNPFTHYNLGISYDHKGRHARAMQAFTRAIELDDRHPDFFHNRGFTQRKQGAYAAAIADYTTAISLDPKHFKSHYNRAYCFSKLGRYEEAVADYAAALQIDSGNANAYHNRGAALAKLGRLEAAVENFNCALRLSPKLTFALNARGLVYDQLQQYDKALADFTEAIRLDQRNPVWLHNRGYTYRNMGELELAIADYSASIKLAPHSHTAYTNRAFAFRKLGRYEAAIEDYTRALREHPGVATKVLNNRAYCFARLNLFEDAVRDYTEVLATDPVNAHALYNRGISFEKCGKYNAAVDDFTRAIRLAPEVPSTASSYYSRGTSRLQLHQVPQAAEDLKQALKLDLIACGLRGEALYAFRAEHPAWRLLQDLGAD
ncbi:Tetratricopeptide repeat family protein [Leishmania donovani]|uniref:Tetratricopeptide repeat family protein n=1 Tax=Leishmania donovani TaxID=5661 RepID=A0A504XBB8_LEIDO|nr:Tetratricopeptide repeat family protein [Leishmania donovani]